MEIKLSAGDKINIPENCKATIEDNQIIIEEQKEVFKDGDILHSNMTGRVVIFKSYEGESSYSFCVYYDSSNYSKSGWISSYFRHATEEEKQRLFDKLKEEGLRWNAETKQIEKIRRRAEKGELYLYIARNGEIVEEREGKSSFDDRNYNAGNYYYLPEEREQAEEDAKAIKAIFEKRLKI